MQTLNSRFAIADQVRFVAGPNGLPLVEVANAHGTATIALQGAQLLQWTPRGEQPVVWLSPAAKYVAGKSMRGGVPVCWPWFGPHAAHKDFPAHGIARTSDWEMLSTETVANGGHRLGLRLPISEAAQAYWPHATQLECFITVGPALEMELVTRNLGEQTLDISEALHTYFTVSDVRQVQVHGLDGCDYVDKVAGGQRKQQAGPVTISGETDRVYLGTEAECWIDDPGYGRRIRIKKTGSRSTVVWNPWIEKADAMGDLGPEGYLHMLCVESANALEDTVRLAPAAEHRLTVSYALEKA